MKKTKLFTDTLINGELEREMSLDVRINKFIESKGAELDTVNYTTTLEELSDRTVIHERALVTYVIREPLNAEDLPDLSLEDDSTGIRVLNDEEKTRRNAELLSGAISDTKMKDLQDLISFVNKEVEIMTPSVRQMNNLDRFQDIKESLDRELNSNLIWARHGAWLVKQALLSNGFVVGKE